ncbi:hypothetical protein [Janthinobacterium lividum]|uniref:hypothetical protein n=1 Tax=Janthinobacterium lividum TaxID=29581 RepID=UPI00140A72B7|nr:hypothetical protein [Janthinobacterium lividum]NHQ93358.1 hypothetical protein [Janthinobacterium lividum]
MRKVRPILFSAPMVRAVLDGSKTQTRRVMKPQPEPAPHRPGDYQWPCNAFQSMVSVSDTRASGAHGMAGDACPHGAHRDQLRVRETFFAYGRWETRFSTKKARDEWHFVDMTTECDRAYQFAADNPDLPLATGRRSALPGWHKRPAIFMPRAASRILLEIASVRVERLNDCSVEDALAEGISHRTMNDPRVEYQRLWDDINGAGAWAANPWVWAIEFRRVTP